MTFVLFSVEPFERLGTEGRKILRDVTRRGMLRSLKNYSKIWPGKRIQVEEWDYGSFYSPSTKTWVYGDE